MVSIVAPARNAVIISPQRVSVAVSFCVCVLAAWRSLSALVSINKVNLRRVRLVQGWVTVSRFNSQCGTSISVYNQPPRSTQPGHPFVGRCNEYQPKGDDALRLGRKGSYGSCVGGRWHGSYLSTLEVQHDKALYKFTLLYFTLCVCVSDV